MALVGIGNCASALVQGVEYYKNAKAIDENIGLGHPDFAGFHVSDIQFVAAFDVVDSKVDTDLSEAIFAKPNNVLRFAEVPNTGINVQKGPELDVVMTYVQKIMR